MAKPVEKTEVPIASLIDVVFLLIMFFVVTANLDADTLDKRIKLVEAENMRAESKKPPFRVVINIDYLNDTDDVEYRINGTTLTLKGLEATLKSSMRQAQQAGKDAEAVIRAEGQVDYRHVDIAFALVAKSGFSKVKIAAEVSAGGQ